MNLNIIDAFKVLGLGEEYAKIYSILLEGGKLRVIEIAEKTLLPRTSCYEYLPKLIELNLVEELNIGKSRFFSASSPAILLSLMYKHKNEMNYTLKELETTYNELIERFEVTKSIFEFDSITGEREIRTLLQNLAKYKVKYTIASKHLLENLSSDMKKIVNSIINESKYIELESFNSSKPENFSKNTLKVLLDDKILLINFEKFCVAAIEEENYVQMELFISEVMFKKI